MEKTLVSIEMVDGIKYVRYIGYAYYIGDESDKPFRIITYTWLACPLVNAIEYGISKWEEDNQQSISQYLQECSRGDYDAFCEQCENIKEKDVNEDTPCGIYFVEFEA